MRHDARRKLSHRRLATRTAIAELPAPTAVGSGDLLGCWLIWNLFTCHVQLALTVNPLDDLQTVNGLANVVICECAPYLNHKRNAITNSILFSCSGFACWLSENADDLLGALTTQTSDKHITLVN